MQVFSVFMEPGGSPSAELHEVEEPTLGLHLPSSSVDHTYDEEKAPHQTKGFFRFRRRAYKAFFLLPAVAILFLLLNTYLCRLEKTKNVAAGGRTRRLASREVGKEEDREAASRVAELCGLLEEALSFFDEESGPDKLRPQTPAAHFEVVEEDGEQEPRKRKRKIKWLEQGAAAAAEQFKRAKAEPQPLPTSSFVEGEEDLFTVVEQTVTAAIDAVEPASLAEWELEFSEDLLWTPLPEMPFQALPDSGESEASVSDEQSSQVLLQAAGQLQGDLQLSASSVLLEGDHAAQRPLDLAGISSKLDSIEADHPYAAEVLQGDHTYAAQRPPELARISSKLDSIRADHPYAAQQPSALAPIPSEQQPTQGDPPHGPQKPSESGHTP